MGFHSVESVHMMVEAERRVYADRSEHLGDPDYYKVPMKTLLSSEYNADRFKDFDRQKATKSQDVKPESLSTKKLHMFPSLIWMAMLFL